MKKILLFVAFFVALFSTTSLVGCNKAEPEPVEDPFAVEESNASVVVTAGGENARQSRPDPFGAVC